MYTVLSRYYWLARGVLGFIIDISRIATFKFVNPHAYTKFMLINMIRNKTGATTFVETGTYRGITTARASHVFERVYTIELDDSLYESTKNYLTSLKNITFIHGDASKKLSDVFNMGEVNNALVFLDGHYSGGVTACGGTPEPAEEELEILANYTSKISAIIIDDFRSFGESQDFPTKSNLLKSAELYFGSKEFEISVHLDQVIIMRS